MRSIGPLPTEEVVSTKVAFIVQLYRSLIFGSEIAKGTAKFNRIRVKNDGIANVRGYSPDPEKAFTGSHLDSKSIRLARWGFGVIYALETARVLEAGGVHWYRCFCFCR